MRSLAASITLLVGLSGLSQAAVPKSALEEIPPSKSNYRLNWVEPGGDPFAAVKPLAEMQGGSANATVQTAATRDAWLLKIVVRDETHENGESGADIWKGDSIQVAIDGAGDGTAGMPPNTAGAVGPDDLALSFAVTSGGPVGWLNFAHSTVKQRGALPKEWFDLQRDESAKTTTYRLSIPWTALDVPAGLFPELGLAVQVNDSDPGREEQERLYFGRGADGQPRPGLFERIGVENPPFPVRAGKVIQQVQWDAVKGGPQVLVAVQDKQKTTLTAFPGGGKLSVPASGTLRRVLVGFQHLSHNEKFGVKLGETSIDGKATVPSVVYADLITLLDSLIRESKHPLFTRHLSSVKALTTTEWGRLEYYWTSNPKEAAATLRRLESMLLGFQRDAGKWEAYLDGRRSMILAFVSRQDQSLQYYMFSLPKDWDPEKAYPLFFELHGAGDPNPLNGVASRVGTDPSAPDLAGYTSPKTFAEVQRNGYWCQPFGRGNSRYRGIGEVDIFEALEDVHAGFKIDPDRRYLYGFSMGGGGTFSIGMRYPHLWAAAAIFAGGLWNEAKDLDLAKNLKGMPVWCWVGTKDFLYEPMLEIQKMLQGGGVNLSWQVAEGVAHEYRMDAQEAGLNWLQQHVRKLPNPWVYTAEPDQPRTVRGITLYRNIQAGLPKVRVEETPGKLDFVTENVRTFDWVPGPDGFEPQGVITVNWNGKPVYTGSAAALQFNEDGAAKAFDPKTRRGWERR